MLGRGTSATHYKSQPCKLISNIYEPDFLFFIYNSVHTPKVRFLGNEYHFPPLDSVIYCIARLCKQNSLYPPTPAPPPQNSLSCHAAHDSTSQAEAVTRTEPNPCATLLWLLLVVRLRAEKGSADSSSTSELLRLLGRLCGCEDLDWHRVLVVASEAKAAGRLPVAADALRRFATSASVATEHRIGALRMLVQVYTCTLSL